MKKKIFISIETLIYLTFITLDFLKINSTYIKYSGIVVCFVYTILDNHKRIDSSLFTLIADLFLLVLNKHYEIGLTSFIIVQIIYIYYLGNIDNKHYKSFMTIRFSLLVIAYIVIYFMKNADLLTKLVLFYFCNEFISAIEACFTVNKLFALGLILFVCCDVCVGLFNINIGLPFTSFLMWIFYLPSQVLINLN